MTEPTKSFAVLIDADNANAATAKPVFEEIAKFGEANVRRIYGDFSDRRLKKWAEVLAPLAIEPIQQYNYTTGKNAADITLVIEAMDLMHRGGLDGFCLVSSDSDFTRLAQRLRASNKTVIGFGEKKTPEAFRAACNRFIYVENLLDDEPGDGKAPAKSQSTKTAPSKAVPIISRVIGEMEDDDGWVSLGAVGQRVLNAHPDFDTRSYGCSSLSALVQKSGGFELEKSGNGQVRIRKKARR